MSSDTIGIWITSWLGMIFALIAAILIAELAIIGQPPKHCHYFVPVVGKPGIYSCSEYARPVKP